MSRPHHNETVVAELVRHCIAGCDHPDIVERDEAVAELALYLEGLIQERLREEWARDFPFKSLDGIKTASVETDGQHILASSGRSTS
jgi:hypothetical protein